MLKLVLRDSGYDWTFVPVAGSSFTDSGSDSCGGALSDTTSPSIPTNLVSTAAEAGNVGLAWGESNDAVGVIAYDVYRDTQLIGSTTATSFTDTSAVGGSSYQYYVTARDAAGNDSAPSNTIPVTVVTANQSPSITSDGGGPSASLSPAENQTAVTDVDATDPDPDPLTYSIAGGPDAARFAINGSSGVLAFVAAPNFEAPTDVGGNNVYDVTVSVSDGHGGSDSQALAVAVQNSNEFPPLITSNGGGSTAAASAAENQTAVTDVNATDGDADVLLLLARRRGRHRRLRYRPEHRRPDLRGCAQLRGAGRCERRQRVRGHGDGRRRQPLGHAGHLGHRHRRGRRRQHSADDHLRRRRRDGFEVGCGEPDRGHRRRCHGPRCREHAHIHGLRGRRCRPLRNQRLERRPHLRHAPNFESPTDVGANNVYDVTVTVSDGAGGSDSQAIAVTVTNVNEFTPVITSNGGGPTAAVSAPENQTAVTDINASDGDLQTLTYSISGGPDAARFAIVPATGVLTFATAPNFEAPTDVGTNNVYDVTVQASDGLLSDTQALAVTVTDVSEGGGAALLYFSVTTAQTLSGIPVTPQDIVAFDGQNYSLFVDGSDVGLDATADSIDAFALLADGRVLVSATGNPTVPGVTGARDEDVLALSAGQRGDTTTGTWSTYLDGSVVGLEASGEDTDAVELLEDGRLLISTSGAVSVTGVTGEDKDVLAFTPGAPGTWAMYFYGSDVGLTASAEDIDGVAVKNGNVYLSTTGNFGVTGLSGADEDVFACNSATTGPTTSCASFLLFFDGSLFGLAGNDLFAIDLP